MLNCILGPPNLGVRRGGGLDPLVYVLNKTFFSKFFIFKSSALQTDGIWEPYITPILQMALNKYPESILIDVGANIGYYSLMAAKMGHTSIATWCVFTDTDLYRD